MNARGLLAAGYVRNLHGEFRRNVVIRDADNVWRVETLVRSSTGKLLRVERSGRAIARRGKVAP